MFFTSMLQAAIVLHKANNGVAFAIIAWFKYDTVWSGISSYCVFACAFKQRIIKYIPPVSEYPVGVPATAK